MRRWVARMLDRRGRRHGRRATSLPAGARAAVQIARPRLWTCGRPLLRANRSLSLQVAAAHRVHRRYAVTIAPGLNFFGVGRSRTRRCGGAERAAAPVWTVAAAREPFVTSIRVAAAGPQALRRRDRAGRRF